MIKVDSFSFQGVNGAYSEQAGKNIFPNAEEVFLHLQNLKKQVIIISNSGKKSSDNISRMKKLGAKFEIQR